MCPLAIKKHPNNQQGIPDFWLASFMKLEVNNQHILSENTAGKSTYLFHNQSPPLPPQEEKFIMTYICLVSYIQKAYLNFVQHK